MTDIVLGIRFDADGQPLVSVVRGSREELEKLKKTAQENNAEATRGAETNRRYGESLQAVARFGALAGTAVVALTGALALKVRQTTEAASALQRLSDQTGRSVEWLQRMKYVEDQLGVSTGSLIRAYQEMPKIILDAIGPNSESARALKALGIDPKQVRDVDQGMALIAERFRQVHDPVTQAQLATMLFKQRGEELMPFLREGPEGIRRLYEEGGRYAHITKEGAQQAEELRRQWSQLEQGGGQLARMIQSDLLPPLVRFLDILLQMQRAGNSLPASINAAINLPQFGASPEEQIRNIDKALASRRETFSGMLAPGPLLQPLLGIGESNLLAARQAALFNQQYEARTTLRRIETTTPADPFFEGDTPINFVDRGALARTGAGGGSRGARGVSFQELMERGANDMYRELDRAMETMLRERQHFIDMADPIEAVRREMDRLDKQYADNRITVDLYLLSLEKLQNRMEDLNGSNKEQLRAEKERDQELKRQASELKRQQDQAEAERQRFTDNIERSLVDSIMRGFERGESIAQNFWHSVRNMFLTQMLTIPVRFVAQAMTGVVGALGLPGVANAGGGIGNLGGLGNLFSGGGQFMADFGNFFGNIGTVTEAGSTFGLMDAIGGFAAAHPLGMAAMALGAIGLVKSLFGSKKTPAVLTGRDLPSGVASYGGLAGTVYGNDSNQGYRWAGEQWSGVFQPQIRGVYDTIARLGGALGYDTSGIRGYQANITTGQFGDAAEILPSVLAQLSDQLIQQVIPNLAELAHAGETATQTLERIAVSYDQLRVQEVQARASLTGMVHNLPGVLGITSLEGFRGSLGVSEYLSPLQQFRGAREAYFATRERARRGDISAINAFPDVAQQYLGEARDMYASGPQFAAIFSDVNRTLNNLIGQQRDVQADLLKGIDTSIVQTGQSLLFELKAIRQQFNATTKVLADTQAELRRIAA